MDDEEVQPARRYPALQRTPPDYQTFIKFLVMASILDSVWVSGPRQTGSPCGLARPARRPLDLSPEPAVNNNSLAALPADVQEALLQLNITPACRPDELRTTGTAPTLLRVLGVLLFNAFVVWSNFGAGLVTAPGPPSWTLASGKGAASSVGEVTVWPAAEDAARTAERLAGEDAARTAGRAVCEDAARTDGRPVCEDAARTAGRAVCEDATRTAGRVACEDAARTAARREDATEDYATVEVPWYIQLAYFASLVVLVLGLPCCPAVLENACGFLMC